MMIVASVVSWISVGAFSSSLDSTHNELASVNATPITYLISSIVAVVAVNFAKRQSA